MRMTVETSPVEPTTTTSTASSLPKTAISVEGAASTSDSPKAAPPKTDVAKPTPVRVEVPKAEVETVEASEATPAPQPATPKPSATKPKMVVIPEESEPSEPQVAPRPTVAAEPQASSQPRVEVQQPAASYEFSAASGADAGAKELPQQPVTRARESAVSWVRRTFPGHEHAFWGGVVALLIALLVFMIGLWRVLFIGIVVIIGIAIGQVLDGDPKMVNAIRSLFDSDRGQN